MNSITSFLILILIIIGSIGIGIGFDLKKPSSWLYVLCGFLIGPLLVTTTGDLKLGIMVGIFIALILIWFGPIALKRRQQYKK